MFVSGLTTRASRTREKECKKGEKRRKDALEYIAECGSIGSQEEGQQDNVVPYSDVA